MLKPQNIVQAASADFARRSRNSVQAEYSDPSYEHYAFHRGHVRRARDVKQLLVLALMDPLPGLASAKGNTKMIYGDTMLLLAAVRQLA